MTTQPTLFPLPAPEVDEKETVITVKVPAHIETIAKHTWGNPSPEDVPDEKLARATAYTLAANLMLRRGMEPLGVTDASRHVLCQVGTNVLAEAYRQELARRLPHMTVFIELK